MTKSVEVLTDLSALVQRGLEITLDSLNHALKQRGQFTIALAGGNTPKPLYAALAKQDLPWEKIHVFWGDERYVPTTDPDSNEGMARQAWLDHVPIPAANIHPMPTHFPAPELAARDYEQHLKQFFSPAGGFPALDLIHLGMGPDGHTASLFPHTKAVQVGLETSSAQEIPWVTVGNKDGQPRLTLTAPLINQARRVLFLVTGANKQAALRQIFAPTGDAFSYPARLIQPQGELIWLLDRLAAQDL